MTPGLLINNLRNGQVNITDLSLLVFDECHHTLKLTNYNKVMGYSRKAMIEGSEAVIPQVLGLTASPNIRKAREVSEAIQEIKTLMENLDVGHLSTVVNQRDDYNQYFEDPENVSIPVTTRDDDDANMLLCNAMRKVEEMLKTEAKRYNEGKIYEKIDLSDPPIERSHQRYGQWVTSISTYLKQIQFIDQSVGRFLVTCCRNLQVYHSCMQTNLLLDYKDVREELEKGLAEFEYESQSEECLDIEKELVKILKDLIQQIPDKIGTNPDIEQISKELLQEFSKRGEDSRFLVFIKERMFAKTLAQRLPLELKCYHLTGCHADIDNAGMSSEQQVDVIKRFSTGEYKCLVATSVAFEGISIPNCNMTIRYKLDANVITSLQMKGRIRTKDGKYLILGDERDMRKEQLNIERQIIMDSAVNKIVKFKLVSKEEIRKKQLTLYMDEERKRKESLAPKPSGPFEMHCHICKKFICLGEELRILKDVHTICLNQELLTKVGRKPYTRKRCKFDDLTITSKIVGPCNHEWGVVMSFDSLEVIALSHKKMQAFDKESREYKPTSRSKEEFPLHIQQCSKTDWENYKALWAPNP